MSIRIVSPMRKLRAFLYRKGLWTAPVYTPDGFINLDARQARIDCGEDPASLPFPFDVLILSKEQTEDPKQS